LHFAAGCKQKCKEHTQRYYVIGLIFAAEDIKHYEKLYVYKKEAARVDTTYFNKAAFALAKLQQRKVNKCCTCIVSHQNGGHTGHDLKM